MSGLRTTSMTLEEMRAARERGESKSDWARVRSEQAADVEPPADADSSDATQLMREATATRRSNRFPTSGNCPWRRVEVFINDRYSIHRT